MKQAMLSNHRIARQGDPWTKKAVHHRLSENRGDRR
jgi:hypothetical protein